MFRRLFGRGRKDTPRAQTPPASKAAMQDALIRAIVANRIALQDGEWEDREWLHIAVDHELLAEGDTRSSTQALVLARKPGGALESLSFRLGRETKQSLVALRDEMRVAEQDPWTVANITIERDGRYAFAFGYGPPPRINGDLLHMPLKGLLERYKAQHGIE